MLIPCFLAGCGGSGSSVAHLGCHQYCQQAGSPQGSGGSATGIRIDSTGAVVTLPDGTVPLTLTCMKAKPCKGGAVLLEGPSNTSVPSRDVSCGPNLPCMAKSDLDVGAHSTRTVGIPLSPTGLQLLRSFGRVSVQVLIETLPDGFEASQRPLVLTLNRGAPAGSIIVGESPTAIAVGEGGAWVARKNDNTVTRIDPSSAKIIGKPIPVGVTPDAVALGDGTAWVANGGTATAGGTITRIDASTGQVNGQPIGFSSEQPEAIAAGPEGVWVALGNGAVTRLDASTGRVVVKPIRVSEFVPDGIALANGSVWVAVGDKVVRVDASTGHIIGAPISLGNGRYAIASGEGGVWVANGGKNAVTRIDARTGAVGKPITVGLNPDAITVGDGSVWVANSDSNTVTRIDASTGAVIGTPINVGVTPNGIAVAQGTVWVTNGGADTVTRIDASSGKLRAGS